MRNFLKNSQNFYQILLNFIQDLFQISYEFHSKYLKYLKYFLKIFTILILKNFPEICTNFSKNFLKNLVKNSIKFYFRIAQILCMFTQNCRKFSLF